MRIGIVPRPVALVALAIGLVLALAGVRLSRLGRETRRFTRTQGRVLESRVEELPGPAEEGGPRFRPLVRYAFEARGRTWESDQVSVDAPPGASSADPEDARRTVERHPAGSAVDVWFDPADPRRSVLVRGAERAPVLVAVVAGILLAALGILLLAR